MVDPQAQADPKFQTPFAYTRITAQAVREALRAVPELSGVVPGRQTVGRVLHRLGYRLRRVLKTRPEKIPETDAIFENVREARARTSADPDTLRISIDTKAKVGDFSRGGEARGAGPVRTLDHDLSADALLVPFGVLELNRGAEEIHRPLFIFGHSKETSDFIADGLECWWKERKAVHPGVQRLHIELDNGPEIGSSRTQFMNRLVGFADRHQVEIELVYLPPYHCKYNPVERCWGILEKHWNGALLNSVEQVLNWAGTMTRRTIRPLVRQITTLYERGIRLTEA